MGSTKKRATQERRKAKPEAKLGSGMAEKARKALKNRGKSLRDRMKEAGA